MTRDIIWDHVEWKISDDKVFSDENMWDKVFWEVRAKVAPQVRNIIREEIREQAWSMLKFL